MKKYKPTSAGRRDGSVIEYKKKLTSTQSTPLKALTFGGKSSGGRNNQGRTTVLNRGGGNKRKYRMVDFRYDFVTGAVSRSIRAMCGASV